MSNNVPSLSYGPLDPFRSYPQIGSPQERESLGQAYPAWFFAEDGLIRAANLLAFWMWGALDPQSDELAADNLLGIHVFGVILRCLDRIPIERNLAFFAKKFAVLKKLARLYPVIAAPMVEGFRKNADLRRLYDAAQESPDFEWSYRLTLQPPALVTDMTFLETEVDVYRVIEGAKAVGFIATYRPCDDPTRQLFVRERKLLVDRYSEQAYIQHMGGVEFNPGQLSGSPEWVPVTDAVGALASDLRAVRPNGKVRIYCGEADPTIYNHPQVLDAIEEVTRKNAQIRAVTGPVVLVDDKGVNELLRLPQRGHAIYHRAFRGPEHHFRVVESELAGYRLWTEFPHRPMELMRTRRIMNLTAVSPERYQELAEYHKLLFEASATRAEEWSRDTDVTMPLVTTSKEYATLIEELSKADDDPEFLFPDELLALDERKRLVPYHG